MSLERLELLAEGYPLGDTRQLFAVARERVLRGELAILELAALAANLTIDSIINLRTDSSADPLLLEAFARATNGMELELLSEFGPEELQEYLSNTRRHYFEALCVDRLNKGGFLGEVQLQLGQQAEFVKNPDESDWDVQVVNQEDGSINHILSVKTSGSMGLVWETLGPKPARASRGLAKAAILPSTHLLLMAVGVPRPAINASEKGVGALVSRYGNLATVADIARENADMLMALTPQPAAD